MQKINFSTSIHASKEKVWKTLWEDPNYRSWTSVFAADSHAETENWKEGSRVLFLDGKGNGMVSLVATNRPNEFMSFKHLGVVKDGKEDVSNEKENEWAGATENYTLKAQNGNTELLVEMDITEEYKEYFLKTWPQALEKIKQLSEK
jgi:hypothetical protein